MHWADRMMQRFYPSKHASPYIQPPVLAEAVEHIYEQGNNIEFITRILPQLKKYYRYLDKERSRSNDGLLEIIISYESGKDRSPEYDLVYGESNAKPLWRGPMPKLMIRHWIRGWNLDKIFAANLFRVKDVLFNCIYAQNLCALSRLCQVAGEEEEGQSFREKAFQVEDSILCKMYCQETGLFYSLSAQHDSVLSTTVMSR
jgi:neutral trehalase